MEIHLEMNTGIIRLSISHLSCLLGVSLCASISLAVYETKALSNSKILKK